MLGMLSPSVLYYYVILGYIRLCKTYYIIDINVNTVSNSDMLFMVHLYNDHYFMCNLSSIVQ